MDKTLTRRLDPLSEMFETALSIWRSPWPQQRAPHAPYTRETAASLYERAAGYERTQPGFAADLRAAAEAMDLAAARA